VTIAMHAHTAAPRVLPVACWQFGMLLTLGALMVAGCGDGRGTKPTYTASGRLLDATGKPAVGAVVILHPVAPDAADPARPTATVGADGTFRLTTYRTGDGAPEGEYFVTAMWPEPRKTPLDPPGCDRLGGAWMRPGDASPRVTIGTTAGQSLPEIKLPPLKRPTRS
jgi:hypothetical protein